MSIVKMQLKITIDFGAIYSKILILFALFLIISNRRQNIFTKSILNYLSLDVSIMFLFSNYLYQFLYNTISIKQDLWDILAEM